MKKAPLRNVTNAYLEGNFTREKLFSTRVTIYKTMSIKTVAFLPHIIYSITGLKIINHWHAKSELQFSGSIRRVNSLVSRKKKDKYRCTKMIKCYYKCLKLSFEKWSIFYFSSPLTSWVYYYSTVRDVVSVIIKIIFTFFVMPPIIKITDWLII